MLKNLLKYDLKWVFKGIIVFYILSFIFSITGRLLGLIDNSIAFSVISKILTGTAITMIINSLINCFIRLWVRFIRNIYKDESYLTHTLPVQKSKIYLSKILSAIISIFITILVIVTCLAICFYSKANIEVLKNVLDIAAETLNTSVFKFLLLAFAVVFAEILFLVLIGYVSIILGHKSNKGKMVKSVIIGFGLYVLTQVVSLGVILFAGIFDASIMNLINTTSAIDINVINKILIGSIGLYVIYNIIYYIIGKKQFEKGVNVE